MDERYQITAWLRSRAEQYVFDESAEWRAVGEAYASAADAIERGEHLSDQPQ